MKASCGLPFQTKRRGNNASVTDKDAETAKIVQKQNDKTTTKRMQKDKCITSTFCVLVSKIVF